MFHLIKEIYLIHSTRWKSSISSCRFCLNFVHNLQQHWINRVLTKINIFMVTLLLLEQLLSFNIEGWKEKWLFSHMAEIIHIFRSIKLNFIWIEVNLENCKLHMIFFVCKKSKWKICKIWDERFRKKKKIISTFFQETFFVVKFPIIKTEDKNNKTV